MPDGRSVLVVDDDPLMLDALATTLEAAGYTAVRAPDGAQALAQAERRRPDLVLTDLRMPRADGFALIEGLKARAATRSIPVVAVTAAPWDDIRRALDAGCVGYVTKPVDPDTLHARVSGFLHARGPGQAAAEPEVGAAPPAESDASAPRSAARGGPAGGRPWLGLRARLAALVLLALLPVLGLTLSTGWEQRRAAAAHAQDEALRLARLAASEHEQLIEGARRLLVALAHVPPVRAAEPAACRRLLAGLLAQSGAYANLGVARPDGRIACSARDVAGAASVADHAWFRDAVHRRAFAVGDYQVGRITGKPSLNFGYPVPGADGRLDAVLFAAVDLAWVNELAARARLPEAATLTLVDAGGRILARHPDPHGRVGQSVGESAGFRAMLARPGEGTLRIDGLDGVPQLLAVAPLGGGAGPAAAFLTIDIPTATAFGAVNRQLARNVAGLALVTACGLVAAWIVGDRVVVRPARTLVAAAERVAAGELAVRTGLSAAGGELGQLARSFDDMTAGLEARQLEAARVAERLRDGERSFRLLFASNPHPMWVYDLETLAFLEVNDAAQAHYGYSRTEFLELRITDIRPTDEVPHLLEDVAGPRAALRPARGWRHRTKDGRVLDVEISSHTLDLAGRKAVLVVAQDVTSRRQAEAEIRRLNAELEARVRQRTAELEATNRELEAFSYSVSHDLRAPLRAIDGFSRILVEDHGPRLAPEARRQLDIVRANTRQMGQLVDDLLAFSRLGRTPLAVHPIRLDTVVRDALEDLGAAADGRTVDIEVAALAPCRADPALMKQVFVNLLGNALKFTRTREAPRIEVGCHVVGGDTVYHVRDNGVGFDMRYAAKLFGVFQRLHRAEEYEGTGVGLAIVQRVIQRHGGRVWAEAEVEKGATFYFTVGEPAP
jgi:PAS domain S-box-containing protein